MIWTKPLARCAFGDVFKNGLVDEQIRSSWLISPNKALDNFHQMMMGNLEKKIIEVFVHFYNFPHLQCHSQLVGVGRELVRWKSDSRKAPPVPLILISSSFFLRKDNQERQAWCWSPTFLCSIFTSPPVQHWSWIRTIIQEVEMRQFNSWWHLQKGTIFSSTGCFLPVPKSCFCGLVFKLNLFPWSLIETKNFENCLIIYLYLIKLLMTICWGWDAIGTILIFTRA